MTKRFAGNDAAIWVVQGSNGMLFYFPAVNASFRIAVGHYVQFRLQDHASAMGYLAWPKCSGTYEHFRIDPSQPI